MQRCANPLTPVRAGQRDRGALAIEAALIVPLLVLLVFGVIEWSLVLRDQVEITSVARAGARTTSQLAPLQNPYVPPAEPISITTAKAIQSAASGLPYDAIDYILVYRANDLGYPGRNGSTVLDCDATESTCDKLIWFPDASDPDGGRFVRDPGVLWNAALIDACLGEAGHQSVGVYIKARHEMITGIFPSPVALSARTVMKFEPQKPGRCDDPGN